MQIKQLQFHEFMSLSTTELIKEAHSLCKAYELGHDELFERKNQGGGAYEDRNEDSLYFFSFRLN